MEGLRPVTARQHYLGAGIGLLLAGALVAWILASACGSTVQVTAPIKVYNCQQEASASGAVTLTCTDTGDQTGGPADSTTAPDGGQPESSRVMLNIIGPVASKH